MFWVRTSSRWLNFEDTVTLWKIEVELPDILVEVSNSMNVTSAPSKGRIDPVTVWMSLNFDRGIFMGKGYVVLGCNVEDAQPLQHQLNWDTTQSGKDNWQVLLYWNTMPVYFKYSQEEGHCRADSAELKGMPRKLMTL
ncbi:hypothetical protein BD408DRAFT_407667 [Parasitella parasitica]|nr:hypothetical protein BD408DRAFT_407667 [Parasitella parasitica]